MGVGTIEGEREKQERNRRQICLEKLSSSVVFALELGLRLGLGGLGLGLGLGLGKDKSQGKN